MLNLQSCVHFHEIMLVWIEVKNEFDGTCIVISNSSGSFNGWLTDLRSDGLWNVWRSFFNDLLMASLDWTVSFVKMNVVFHHVTKHLNFDMSWLSDVLFNQHSVIAERLKRLSFAWFQGFLEILFLSDDSHTLSTTSWDSLDKNWVSNFLCLLVQVFSILILLVVTRDDWNVGCSHDFFALTFAAHCSYGWRWRANELDTILDALFGEFSVFGQETKAGMKCLAARFEGNLKDFFGVEITLWWGILSNSVSSICHFDEFGVFINIAVDGDSLDAHFFGSADDSAGDLSSVSYEYPFDETHWIW